MWRGCDDFFDTDTEDDGTIAGKPPVNQSIKNLEGDKEELIIEYDWYPNVEEYEGDVDPMAAQERKIYEWGMKHHASFVKPTATATSPPSEPEKPIKEEATPENEGQNEGQMEGTDCVTLAGRKDDGDKVDESREKDDLLNLPSETTSFLHKPNHTLN